MKDYSIISAVGRLRVAVFALLITGCSITNSNPCTNRRGDCFEASIQKTPAVRITDRQRLAPYESTQSTLLKTRLNETMWIIPNPIKGGLDIDVQPNEAGRTWFGMSGTLEVEIIPLQGQVIATKPQDVQSSSLLVDGKPVLQRENVVAQDTLPKGDYLLRIKLSGPTNWDRKTVFVTVE